MTAREYADQVREILDSSDPETLELTVQRLLVLREHDVRDLVGYVSAASAGIEAIHSMLELYGGYTHQVAAWVERGMTRGQFPTVPR